MRSNLWMIDVLADLQEAAQQRGLTAFADQLRIARRVAHAEMSSHPDATPPPDGPDSAVQDVSGDDPGQDETA
ncbi:hypothetical protein [Pseudooceanicola spongiae]|uniref:Uncharacterized protein n=1 Tax=Pseudooceanicola spongiae TaxID=2613965 RepID=A0A7L9WSX2_9RHOB|nr:hypothetical protein [Pseudooceanicola spongiae]QOL82982.1 hypothetical protein F3W81_20360 [Pseudooceanicola spongiae]